LFDHLPKCEGWLDTLQSEMIAKKPLAVLGSKYRGYKWREFEDQLPLPLVHHINGNAVYNMSHPLTRLMFKQLIEEANSLLNMVPFDLRMGQMWMEGTLGVAEVCVCRTI
jgi:hypothetical protein